ncbi:hypothetical protein [Aminipila luticellarii]|uniref:Uncharacterized protein n=1 Tax=Aminipila luticellarii TaxID=2507160 RepID=A0A410PY14_9FIRM|nr:hypothetical protein [Aminipila luticellarii]QAT43872.1 hypothetical protein EQM06_11915 [Aminipila luticellarii]
MNSMNNMDCIDSGTENCPCYLAATGDCLICSRLQGKEYCDCLWKGVCIYNEFIQSNQKINNPRKDFSARIVSKKKYLEDLYVITLEVGRGFALKSAIPGSYIFLQAPDCASYYQTPISIMQADTEQGFITVLIKSISAKTKALCMQEENLIVRGVYRGGISGISNIIGRFSRIIPDSKLLVLTKGVGFAPAINLLNWAGSNTETEIIVDPDKICPQLIWDYLHFSGADKVHIKSLQECLGASVLHEKITEGGYTIVAALASDFYIEEIQKELSNLPTPPVFVHSNNANICCGEGICGACSCVDPDGTIHKRCKCL